MDAREREGCQWIVTGVTVRCRVREQTYLVTEVGRARFIAQGPEGSEVFDYGPDWERVAQSAIGPS